MGNKTDLEAEELRIVKVEEQAKKRKRQEKRNNIIN